MERVMRDPAEAFSNDEAVTGDAAAPVLGTIAIILILGVIGLKIGMF